MSRAISSYRDVLGPRFYLEANGELANDLIPYIIKFVYEDETAKIDTLRLTIANPGLKWIDDKRFQQGAKFRVRFGYGSDMSDMKTALIAKAAPTFPQNGMPVIEMVAYNLQKDMNKDGFPINYGAVASSDVAAKIAERYKFKTDIENSKDARTAHRVQPAALTDLQYLMSLAKKLNWDCYIENGTLHFHAKRLEAVPELLFTYYTDGTGTLLKFEPQVDMKAPTATGVAAVDPKTGKVVNEKKAPTREALSTNVPTFTGQVPPITQPSPEADAKVVKKHAEAKQQAIDMRAKKANAEFIGSPRIRARTVIRIEGVGLQYSGNWRVEKSTHTIDPKGTYMVHVQMKKDVSKAGTKATEKKPDGTTKPANNKVVVNSAVAYYGEVVPGARTQ